MCAYSYDYADNRAGYEAFRAASEAAFIERERAFYAGIERAAKARAESERAAKEVSDRAEAALAYFTERDPEASELSKRLRANEASVRREIAKASERWGETFERATAIKIAFVTSDERRASDPSFLG